MWCQLHYVTFESVYQYGPVEHTSLSRSVFCISIFLRIWSLFSLPTELFIYSNVQGLPNSLKYGIHLPDSTCFFIILPYLSFSSESDMEAGVVEKLIDDAINEKADDVTCEKKSPTDIR